MYIYYIYIYYIHTYTSTYMNQNTGGTMNILLMANLRQRLRPDSHCRALLKTAEHFEDGGVTGESWYLSPRLGRGDNVTGLGNPNMSKKHVYTMFSC